MSSRKDELVAKKARLAELKRQRELRQEQLTTKRQSVGEVSSTVDVSGEQVTDPFQAPSPGKTAEDRRTEIDSLVSEPHRPSKRFRRIPKPTRK